MKSNRIQNQKKGRQVSQNKEKRSLKKQRERKMLLFSLLGQKKLQLFLPRF